MTTAAIPQTTDESTRDPSESRAPLDPDERFHLLQNERRRLVVRYLRDAADDRVEMRDIAEQVAAWENDTSVAQLSSTERQRVYIPLYQNHLPKLDDAGVIEYNQSRGVVVPTERVDRLASFIDGPAPADDAGADASGRAWSRYYLGASGVGALLFGGAALSLLPGTLVAATLVALFTAVSLAQYATQTRTRDGDAGGRDDV